MNRKQNEIERLERKLKIIKGCIIFLLFILLIFLSSKRLDHKKYKQQLWLNDQWSQLQQNNYETFITEDNYKIQYIEELDDMKITNLNYK